ncbi:orotate phosphoribosyltransferase [Lacticaseibacillus thailandensis]|uniref:Orotate phosphoribosyltransferase n=1 Tax=Lacticaseibacillus thailandensis DSM 22698 = JCM 13996 TaxID=1423810 RepID=A0A0R2C480_9LACO|nr:orotate phosphoribosyltransferase [Lacticaseibacillus thailandensis]KRM86424.1 orotate phosphoribosyltransferase [Lacticaseibacillus thailandensis DSM 22698 = JCM 13996]
MNNDIANLVASDLLDINAVTIRTDPPFTWASGIKAPIYTDNRLTIAYPRIREQIAAALTRTIAERYPDATVIGGVATAGIPHATLVAANLNLPLIYVRAHPKDHGQGKQTEGKLAATDKVVLIDDLISTGGSVLNAAKAVQATGATVLGICAIFSYQLPDAARNFAAAGLTLTSITDYDHLIAAAVAHGHLPANELDNVRQWRQDPWQWTNKS